MVKSQSLSNDINLVKEFEELKLKQKLLIESLAQKRKIGIEKNLTDFNSKLDFLVQIFKEANNNEEEEANLDEHFDKILGKLDEFDLKYEKRLKEIEDKISNSFKSSEEVSIKPTISAEERTKKLNEELSKKDFSDSKGTIGVDASKKTKDEGDIPPPPDFKVDGKGGSSSSDGEKKKSWFSKK